MTEQITIKVNHGGHMPRSEDLYKDQKGVTWYISKIVGMTELKCQDGQNNAVYEVVCDAIKRND